MYPNVQLLFKKCIIIIGSSDKSNNFGSKIVGGTTYVRIFIIYGGPSESCWSDILVDDGDGWSMLLRFFLNHMWYMLNVF